MPKIIFLDTYYPQVFKGLKETWGYEQRVEQLNGLLFGTSFFYSTAFKRMGWQAEDVIANDPLSFPHPGMAFSFIMSKEPDVIYCQDLSFLSDQEIYVIKARGIKLVCQHSCPWAGNDRISKFDLVFTSFPHYLPRISALGTQAEFLPIAFGEQVLDYVHPSHRDIDIAFVGGVGGGALGSGHWGKGTELLEDVAKAYGPAFHWYGYGVDNLPTYSALRACYKGAAWGIDQYKIYARSKIVINRHGEVAEGYSNNMRMFEATGMGACLFTEYSRNLHQYFNPSECCGYNANDLIERLSNVLAIDWWSDVGMAGQARTLQDHTYTKRLDDAEPHIRRLLK